MLKDICLAIWCMVLFLLDLVFLTSFSGDVYPEILTIRSMIILPVFLGIQVLLLHVLTQIQEPVKIDDEDGHTVPSPPRKTLKLVKKDE